jgi:peptidoglycan/LPS O-acetylase OafA/YrhL
VAQRKDAREKRQQIDALTGLRGLAAGLVFFHHYFQKNWSVPSPGTWLTEGYVGVSIFFTLSGFLITRTYLQRFVAGKISFSEYWVRRFARIYPAYFVLLAGWYLLQGRIEHHSPTFDQALIHFGLLQGFSPSYIFTALTPAWSLTVEECFYLLAPSVFLLFARLELIGRLVALAALGAILWQLGQAFPASAQHVGIYTIFGRFTEFGIGILAAVTLVKKEGWLRSWREPMTLAFFASLVATMGLLRSLAAESGQAYGLMTPYGIQTHWLLSLGTAALCIGAANGSRFAETILGNRPMEYLGRVSYAFYLMQSPLYAHMGWLFLKEYFPAQSGLWWPLLIVLLVPAAAIYHFVEKPAQAYLAPRLSRLASRGRSTSPETLKRAA